MARFPARQAEHTYCGFPLTVHIGDATGEAWNDHDWPPLPEIELLRLHQLKEGSRVFNLGAHQGVVALVLASIVGCRGEVVAVEPDPRNAALALRNQMANGYRHLFVLNAAGDSRTGTLVFDRLYSCAHKGTGKTGTVTVPSFSLDDLTRTFGRPDVLFIDVEGYECRVLAGAADTLRMPDCCIEVHTGRELEEFGGSFESLLAFFPASDFDLYLDDELGQEGHSFHRLEAGERPGRRCMFMAAARKTDAARPRRPAP